MSLLSLIGFTLLTSVMCSISLSYAEGKTAQQLVGACARCHGADGNSSSGQYPSLAQ